jgi:hypothetical protein
MGMNAPDETFRRAGDVLQMQLLEEMRYLRQRLDTVIDDMARKSDVATLSGRLDTEVRAVESKMEANRVELRGEIAKLATSVGEIKKQSLPQWFWPATAAIATILGSSITFFASWSAWHH